MNSMLYGKSYSLPKEIMDFIQVQYNKYPQHNGSKRAKNLLKNKSITYSSLKKMKNYFDYTNKDSDVIEYNLNGGDLMRKYIESLLNSQRHKTKISRNIKRDISESFTLNKNVISIIFDNENKVLLLKRSSYKDQWMPNKWCLPGGAIDANESNIDAINREIFEETQLQNLKMLYAYSIIIDNEMENVYVSLYEGDRFDVKLNEEHYGFGWFSKREIEFLDTVPNIMEYINIAINKK